MSKSDSNKSVAAFICDHCGSSFGNKRELTNHIQNHALDTKTDTNPTTNNSIMCNICNLSFRTKRQLSFHNRKHPKQMVNSRNEKLKHICDGCGNRYMYNCQLKYHIRKCHYNLVANAPYSESKKINDIWYEKVKNTDIIVEIKKVTDNQLLLQKVKDDTHVTLSKMPRCVIDLRSMYPCKSSGIKCKICNIFCAKKDLHKHMIENHGDLLYNKCHKCDIEFKQLKHFLRHVCAFEDNK